MYMCPGRVIQGM